MALQRTIEILDQLIGFPTVSRDSNLDLIRYIKGFLRQIGIEARVIHDETGSKANLYAVIGPADVPGVMLSGHTDVVPTEGQSWSSDPFRMVQRDGRLYGRGTADMKGFIACVLTMAEESVGRALRRPLHLAFSYDEEVGCIGVRRLIDHMAGSSTLPALCIVGEPTSMRTVIAHKGKVAGRISCTGHECHSSHAPSGLNAIYMASDMVAHLRALQDDIVAGGQHDAEFEVPFTTLHVGTIHGGTALNIVPRDCALDFEIRSLPGEDPQPLLDRIRDKAEQMSRTVQVRFPNSGVAVDITNEYPSLNTAPDDEAVATVTRLTGVNSLGKIAFGTEGGLFRQRLGIPTVVCGPGNIEQAHKPDEYVAAGQLAACTTMLRRLLDQLA
ncbi:acetylornithine deacetylase [Rhodoligotrophos defluvii]|uniref:acetylornithine deacetylase n=1 Tax=Rhodoligotrophos defluvii TaxID=2561934 RepID=UPI0010C9B67B|nr:acetylornithine deacetylase [Rhodoligotrophos defluvii]